MAIIVDKEQKRRDIALASTELLLEKGIKKLTVAEVAKTAGVVKGSIYDYFSNKEDIVFEIIRGFIEEFQQDFDQSLDQSLSTREKIFFVFDFLFHEHADYTKHQNIYKEYVSIDFGSENENMCEFNKECGAFFTMILTAVIQEGIDKGELIPSSIDFVEGLLAIEKGFLFIAWSEKKDIQESLTRFLNSLFDLIEVKNKSS